MIKNKFYAYFILSMLLLCSSVGCSQVTDADMDTEIIESYEASEPVIETQVPTPKAIIPSETKK